MAYTPPPSKAPGDIFLVADWNTYIRDNFIASIPDSFTAKGQLFIGTGVNTGTVLAVGTDGYYLRCYSTAAYGVEWGQFEKCRMHLANDQALPSSTLTLVQFDTVDFDIGSRLTTGANARFTAPAAGYYVVQANIYITKGGASFDAGEIAILYLCKNGDVNALENVDEIIAQVANAGVTVLTLRMDELIYLSAGDYIDLRLYQISGAAMTIDNADNATWIAVHPI